MTCSRSCGAPAGPALATEGFVDSIWDVLFRARGAGYNHSTICEFRTKFSAELKDLFKQIGRLAMSMGLIRLNRVGLDGTRVLANSSRHGTRTAKTLAKSAFVYDASCDSYYCPLGRRLEYARRGSESRRGSTAQFRVYRCVDCGDCPLSDVCVTGSGRRTVRRDQHEELRESMSKRMRSDSN